MIKTVGSPRGNWWRAGSLVLVLVLVLLCWVPGARADEILSVRVEEGQNLRDIAKQYLGDPDLWTAILRANDLHSVTEVKVGTELKIPITRIAKANSALAASLAAIQKATQEGARLFAPDEIATAIHLHDQALAARKEARWEDSARLADQAGVSAEEALKVALADRDAKAEALLSDRQGWVEGQRPQDLVWDERPLNAVLVEEEKVRTLSRSSAQITFRDESRLRLSANSQAVIQRMRVDPLSREEEAKVSLVEGDFYALLAGKSQRKNFELQVPNVQTNIDSTNFWVRRDRSGAKFTNYDEGVLQVAAQGEEVTLGRNEGTVVRNGRPPSDKVEVLPPPVLIAPADDEVAFNATTDLRWRPVDGAAGYWLEVGLDPGFRSMVLTRWGLKDPAFAAEKLAVGTYYWRTVALDKFGLPGERSDAWRFHVRADTTPPYLAIGVPAEAAILRESPLRVAGESEPGVVLTLNGEPLAVDADGGFETEIEPAPGVNRLVLEAKDTAGNHTERTRSFVFMPDQQAALAFDETIPRLALRHFVTGRDVITLSGSTEPNAQVQIRAKDGAARASAYSNDKGRFGINVALREVEEAFDIEVVAPSGFATTAELAVTVDREPPEIALEAPPPAVTSVEWLPLRGLAKGAVKLLVNGRPAKLIDQSFDESVTLTQGTNAIELVASDLVGNVKVEKLEVVLDQVPPQLVRTALSRDSVTDGGPVTVDVVASDPSGVKQAAPFAVQIGNAVYTDFLKFNPSSKTYRATLILPKQASGRVALKDVELEDYAGNKKRYTFR